MVNSEKSPSSFANRHKRTRYDNDRKEKTKLKYKTYSCNACGSLFCPCPRLQMILERKLEAQK